MCLYIITQYGAYCNKLNIYITKSVLWWIIALSMNVKPAENVSYVSHLYWWLCYWFCIHLASLYTLFSFWTDIDECQNRDTCQHECKNTIGSYQCVCPPGYRLMLNGKTCQGEKSLECSLLLLDIKNDGGRQEKILWIIVLLAAPLPPYSLVRCQSKQYF